MAMPGRLIMEGCRAGRLDRAHVGLCCVDSLKLAVKEAYEAAKADASPQPTRHLDRGNVLLAKQTRRCDFRDGCEGAATTNQPSPAVGLTPTRPPMPSPGIGGSSAKRHSRQMFGHEENNYTLPEAETASPQLERP